MVDQRSVTYIDPSDTAVIHQLCDRRFGIGADGLILLENSEHADFKMVYFNADGRESTMCGNGGRCIVHFAHALGVFDTECTFEAIDGMHSAFLKGDWVHLQMNDVEEIKSDNGIYILDTGSPHYVKTLAPHENLDIVSFGKSIRYNDTYKEEGINVNIVHRNEEGIAVRTYERGVEDETLSCGTGAVASAIASHLHNATQSPLKIKVQGGELEVTYRREGEKFTDIYLCGPAEPVFTGKVTID